ncbi:Protein kinase domain [Trypanosoma melophagium]|uniref:Protein kinase domain n=1 Tax=Trypanosoma melophagium TaxID=715481 RepID=UPI003519F8B0|nr:Protein kinase domain [Trypanosoma melophagium]
MHSVSSESHWLYDWHKNDNKYSCNDRSTVNTFTDPYTSRFDRPERHQTYCCSSSAPAPPAAAVQHVELEATLETTPTIRKKVNKDSTSFLPGYNYTKSPENETGRGRMWSLDDFEIARKLDEGRFGKIYLAREKSTKCAVVLKCISKDMIRYHNLFHQLRREVELQEYAGRYHPHILRLFAYFWDDMNIFLVLEYAEGGNLQMLLESREHERLLEEEAQAILQPLLLALSFLHERDIIHRDVKPENILFKSKEVKLADFSWAVRLNKRDVRYNRRYTLCGTLDYLSPELVSQRGYTTKADAWSIGVLAYRILCGRPPFEHQSAAETCSRITKGNIYYPEHLSLEAREFIAALLCVNESKRISCIEALQHPFIRNERSSSHLNGFNTELPSPVSVDCSSITVRWETPFIEFPVPSPEVRNQQQQHYREKEAQEGYYKNECKHDLTNNQEIQNSSFNLTIGRTATVSTTATGAGAGAASKVTSAIRSASVSGASFVTVSSSHSTDYIPTIQNIGIPSVLSVSQSDWIPSVVSNPVIASVSNTNISNVAALGVEVNSKSCSEDVGTSSQGASYSRPHLYCSGSDGSGTTFPQNGTLLAPSSTSSLFIIPHFTGTGDIYRGNREEEEVENNCVVRLCFDDSITSLSQLTNPSESTGYIHINE